MRACAYRHYWIEREIPETDMSDGPKPIPVKYVLFSHYVHQQDADFQAYQSGSTPADLEGIQFLLEHLRGLKELLTSPGHEGLLVLFYSPGYERFLKGLAHAEAFDHLILDDSDEGLSFHARGAPG
jgi:hypothetical protein